MSLRFAFPLILAAATSLGASQVSDDQQTPKPAAKGAQQPTPTVQVPVPTPVPTPPQPQEVKRTRGRDLNIQIELTITDQTGTSAPDKKVVSMLAADQTSGRIRAGASASKGELGFVDTILNVDARPQVIENDRILIELTVQYQPLRESQVVQRPTMLNESLSVILQNGKPLAISQAADPVSDRRMTVEVKATIVK
jgi:hypothetical protein